MARLRLVPGAQSRQLLDVAAGDGSRIFGQSACKLPELSEAAKQLRDFAPITVIEDGLHEWKIGFLYDRGCYVMVERGAAGDGAYFVDDPACPDEVLLGLVDLLDNTFAGRAPFLETPARLWKSLLAVALLVTVIAAHVFVAFWLW